MNDKAKSISVYNMRMEWRTRNAGIISPSVLKENCIWAITAVKEHNEKYNDDATDAIITAHEMDIAKRYPLC